MTSRPIETMRSEIIVPQPVAPLVRVSAIPRPFSAEPVRVELPEGGSLADILEVVQPDPVLRRFAHVYVGDEYVCPTWYARVRPKAGADVTIRIVPTGSSGGGQKNALSIVLRIAVVIIAAVATWYLGGSGGYLAAGGLGWSAGAASAGAAVVGAAIPLAGPLLVNAASPPVRAAA